VIILILMVAMSTTNKYTYFYNDTLQETADLPGAK
jgi:hypothetical protein